MRAYSEAYDNFSIEALERRVLHGSLSGGLNACLECCDRWAADGRVALEWFGADGQHQSVTFATFQADAARFANLLTERGIGPGDVVAGLMPRVPELLVAILGAWRVGAVYQPLFTAFGPKAIEDRVTGPQGSKAKLIVTDPLLQAKLDGVADCPPQLLIDHSDTGETGFAAVLAGYSTTFKPVMRRGSDPFILRHHRASEGCCGATRCTAAVRRVYAGRRRSPAIGRLLVPRGSRVGARHVLHADCAAAAWPQHGSL
jgi:acetyl-CoA synthetase